MARRVDLKRAEGKLLHRPLCLGNWKMNKSPQEARAFCQELKSLLEEAQTSHAASAAIGASDKTAKSSATQPLAQMVLLPPALTLWAVAESLQGTEIAYGGQNCHFEISGAFTGENSPKVLQEVGAQYCLVGHSERRKLFHETNDLCAQKLKALIELGLTPILCVGESLEERQSGRTEALVLEQLREALKLAKGDGRFKTPGTQGSATPQGQAVPGGGFPLIVAYEPVWAIGTGQVATVEQVGEVHQLLRQELDQLLGSELSQNIPLVYGGSVKPENGAELLAIPAVDGFLIGGASLDAKSFFALAQLGF